MPFSIKSLPSRRFWHTFGIGWLVAVASICIYATSTRNDGGIDFTTNNIIRPDPPCQLQFFGANQCQFIQEHCSRIDTLGLLPYLKWYFCAVPAARGCLIIALSIWLVVVFAAMATAADKFLAVNLASLVHSLHISENLAGVTIFAFGNGSSDLFSTLAAMNSGSGSLAIAELFGAAAFVTTVVLGSIAVIRPFSVDRKLFLGDVVCFLIAVSVNLALIADGKLELWESLVIIGLYTSFVAYVLIRDCKSSEDISADAFVRNELMGDFGGVPHEIDETTALLIRPSREATSLNWKEDRPKFGDTILQTVVIEQLMEDDDSQTEISDSEQSEASTLCDWASEYEHLADMPPFLKLCLTAKYFHSVNMKSIISSLLRLPATILIGLTTVTQPEIEHPLLPDFTVLEGPQNTVILRGPERHSMEYPLLCIQLILGPQFLVWVFWSQAGAFNFESLKLICVLILCLSMFFLLVNRTALIHPGPRLHVFLSTTGFLTATAWIYVLAAEAVALIKTIGVISNVSDTLLGATIFAIGNSSDDLFANLSVAKRGHPVLASAACIGGPMLNTLLGVGAGSLIQIVRGGYRPYIFHVPISSFVSAASLLTGLSIVLLYVLLSGGKLDRLLGYGLISIWIAFTMLNVYVSVGN